MQRSAVEIADILALCVGKLAALRKRLEQECLHPTREQALEIVKLHEHEFLELALLARGLANSYRNFDVAAVVVGLRRKNSNSSELSWWLRFAANTKAEGGDKYCGEQRCMDAALRKQVVHLIAFFVAGEPQPDHGSGKKGPTLLPCETCRWRMRGLMREDEPMIRADVLVITCNCHAPWVRKHQTVASLHDFHCESIEVD
jgi:hypothetical protein